MSTAIKTTILWHKTFFSETVNTGDTTADHPLADHNFLAQNIFQKPVTTYGLSREVLVAAKIIPESWTGLPFYLQKPKNEEAGKQPTQPAPKSLPTDQERTEADAEVSF